MGAALALLGASCSQLLGIEEARVDPTLLPDANLADSGTGGAGSSGDDGGAGSQVTETGGGQHEAAVDGGTEANAIDSSDGGSAVCRQYCDDLMTFCTGNVKQYLDLPQCLKVCGLFPEGTIGSADTNSAVCRMKYAGSARYAAGSERDAYCRKAGPGSDGSCGAVCDGFCTLMMPTCTAARNAPYFFASMDSCLTTCRGLRDDPPYTVADGTLPDTNDAQCRLFHATSAVMDPDEHCEHAMGVTMCDAKPDSGSDR
jgi:hypothetical protein